MIWLGDLNQKKKSVTGSGNVQGTMSPSERTKAQIDANTANLTPKSWPNQPQTAQN